MEDGFSLRKGAYVPKDIPENFTGPEAVLPHPLGGMGIGAYGDNFSAQFPEPPEDDSEFYTLPNVILTPHAAGSKGQEVWRMSLYMLEEFRRMTGTGECAPKYEVSLKMLETMA